MFTRLLVGLDGSAGADAALTAAIDLGRRFRSSILLAAINEPGATDQRAGLTAAAAARVSEAGLDVEVQQASGAVDDELLRLADEVEALVVGRLGATTSRLLLKSPKPVVVAGDAPSAFQRPAVAYDGGATSTSALELAARYAGAAQLTLDVLHVSDQEDGEGLLAKAGAYLSTEQVAFTTHLLRGPLARVLPAHLASAGIDLLVVGAHGGRRRRSWSVGSNAEQMIRVTRIPVIVIR